MHPLATSPYRNGGGQGQVDCMGFEKLQAVHVAVESGSPGLNPSALSHQLGDPGHSTPSCFNVHICKNMQ